MSEEKPKLLPQDGTKDCVVVMKSLIAAVSIVETLEKVVFQVEEPGEDDYKTKGFMGGFDLGASLLNFAFSYVAGCQCYSPMEPGGEYKELQYTKNLSTVSALTDVYTVLWWIKSSVSMFQGLVDLVAGVKKKNVEEWYSKTVTVVNVALCGAAFIVEFAGDIAAGCVTADNSSFADEKTDKDIYICDTTGYLLDDFKGCMDAAYDLGLKKVLQGVFRGIYIGAGAVIGVAGAVCMILTAAFVNEASCEQGMAPQPA